MKRHVDIKLHYACNNNCIHCVIADQRKTVLERGDRDFQNHGRGRCGTCRCKGARFRCRDLTGGEPTIRKDLPVLVKAATSLGLAVGLQTNGRMLAYPEVRGRTSGLSIRFVIALHGPDAFVHDAVTRAPGSLNRPSWESGACGSR